MGFLSTLKDNTIFGNAKATYEKQCDDFYFRYLSDLDTSIKIKGKADRESRTIQFSGDIFPREVKITNDLFFTDKHGNCYTLEIGSLTTEELEIKLETKTEKFSVTNANYLSKSLKLE